MDNEQAVYDVLKELDIAFTMHKHPPVFTVEEAEKHWSDIRGSHCKNLFLRDKKGKHHYLVILKHSKRMDIKDLEKRLSEQRLSFASEDRLRKYLGLSSGAVSPFGLINDKENHTKVILDVDLQKERLINFHPNINTATLTLSFEDFKRFLAWSRNEVRYMSFS